MPSRTSHRRSNSCAALDALTSVLHPHDTLDGVGDLQDTHTSVPFLVGPQQAVQFGAHRVERHGEIDVEFRGAQQLGGVAGPVLERRRGEVGARQDQSALVPQVHDDVGQRDLLDAPPFLFQHHHVSDTNRVGEGDLDACEHRAQRGLGRQAGDHGQHAGRGEHRLADVAERRKRHQRRGRTEHHHDRHGEPAQRGDLGADLAPVPVRIGQPGVTAGEPIDHLPFGHHQQTRHQPDDCTDQRDHQRVVQPAAPAGLPVGDTPHRR